MADRRQRRAWFALHRYLGLFAGALLVPIGLSGSLIVFAWPLDAWLNRAEMRIEPPAGAARWRSLDEIAAAARAVVPQGAHLGGFSFPRSPDAVFRVNYDLPPAVDGYEVFVHPYTAEVLGQRLWGGFDRCCSAHGPLMAMVYRFHDSFWMGEAGLFVVGVAGLSALVSLVSGMVLWWPRPGRLKAALSIKRGASPQRFIFDLHNAAGVYGLPVVLVLAFTGSFLSFPEQGRALVGLVSPLTQAPAMPDAVPAPGRALLSLDQIAALADAALPGGEFDSMAFPEDGGGAFELYKHADHETMASITRRKAVIDGYSGRVLHIDDRTRRSGGDIFEEWQLGLHSGEALGLPGQILVLIGGLLPTLLYATGWLRWRQKRRAKTATHPPR